MKPQGEGELGLNMDTMAGTLGLIWNITDVIRLQLIFFQKKITLPFPSAQDLATQAAVDLTHALLHPKPARPFCKVGDAQKIALKHQADIFEGATRRRTKVVAPPTEIEDNSTPQRVQCRVSPPQQNITEHSTPTYHRRQNTCQTCSHTTNTTCHGATQC
jgi:hypothetical protein